MCRYQGVFSFAGESGHELLFHNSASGELQCGDHGGYEFTQHFVPSPGAQQVIIASVVTGRASQCPRPVGASLVPKRPRDSVVNVWPGNKCRHYISYDSALCYPRFLLEYVCDCESGY